MSPPEATAERRPELVTRELLRQRAGWVEAATSADHKVVAKLYLGTSLTFLAIAAILFALTRVQLIVPDSTIIAPEIFNRINTATNATFMVFAAIPFVLGLIGYVVPLQIGARGMAMPRLGQVSYWLYAAGAFVFYASFLYAVPEVALSPLPPLADDFFSPTNAVDAWIAGVGLAVLGFVCFAINLVATLNGLRAPGMAWRRAPILAWGARAIGYTLLVIGPVMLAALTMLTVDRQFDGVFFDAGHGGEPLAFMHLSWIFFAGCHAILVVAACAVISEIVPTFSRKPLFSHTAVAGSLVAIAVLGVLAWMQNMYAEPIPDGFAFFAMAAAVFMLVPVGLLFFVWTATMWDGAISAKAPIGLAIAAAVALVIGLGGQLATSVIPVGLQLEHTAAAYQDTVMVMVGFTLAAFAALHYWLPKISGRAVAEGPAKAAAALILGGALLFALMMFLAGVDGQPVDVFRYYEDDGVSTLNLFASLGAFAITLGVLLELANLARSYSSGRELGHDPWGGATLEWFALSPPPPHNFDAVPDVRSAEPLTDIRDAIRVRMAAYVPPAPLPDGSSRAAEAGPQADAPAGPEPAGIADPDTRPPVS
ncbi:MAG: cbb3-type cytochrome c oxidase subunit I [Actinomycetota bacterium]|nr:cbb3-type cytochrome c oxidase subunit I [Actinomycetota bacterium]